MCSANQPGDAQFLVCMLLTRQLLLAAAGVVACTHQAALWCVMLTAARDSSSPPGLTLCAMQCRGVTLCLQRVHAFSQAGVACSCTWLLCVASLYGTVDFHHAELSTALPLQALVCSQLRQTCSFTPSCHFGAASRHVAALLYRHCRQPDTAQDPEPFQARAHSHFARLER